MAQPLPLYRITFLNHGKVYEMYAREIQDESLFGFIEISDIVFGDQGTLVIDPNEEKLRNEFQDVVRTYLPMANIIRIDEVEKQGVAKITVLNDYIQHKASTKNGSPSELFIPSLEPISE